MSKLINTDLCDVYYFYEIKRYKYTYIYNILIYIVTIFNYLPFFIKFFRCSDGGGDDWEGVEDDEAAN